MPGFLDTLKNLGRGLLSSASEGTARAVASFAERYDRQSSLVYQQRAHLPRGRQQLKQQHLTGERAFSTIMRGMGFGTAYPTPWTQDRLRQVQAFHRWVYIAIDAIAGRIASMPPRVALVHPAKPERHGPVQKAIREARFRKSLHAVKPHEEIEEVGPDHPLLRMLACPNAWTKSPGRLWYQAAQFLLLTGDHYQWIVPDAAFGKPLEIWTIPSHWCWGPRISPAGFKEYLIMPFLGGRGQFTIPADEIIHYSFDNPLMPIQGFSPTQAGADWVDQGMYLDRSRTNAFINGTQATGALELGPTYDPKDEDIEAIGSKFLARYQGVQNAGAPFILPPDVKMVALTIAPKDMAFIDSFTQVRDAVSALFRVPHEIMGITDAGSKTAYYGPMKQFNENAIFPLCRMIADVFTAEVCHRWDDHLRAWWEDHSPDSPEEVNAKINLQLERGICTPNEARAEYGLEPREEAWADKLLINPNLIPMDEAEQRLEDQKKQQQQMQKQQAMQAAGGGAAMLNPGTQEQGAAPGQAASRVDGQGDAEEAALAVNDAAWQSDQEAIEKAHCYNRRFEASGHGWRLTQDGGRWKAHNPSIAKNGDGHEELVEAAREFLHNGSV